ncbi:PO21 protein, partial [Nothocercus julius]|nr:PO21 protein [Nothocercus julius]
ILSSRLQQACPINMGQRGFIAAPSCSENLKLLQSLIKSAKGDRRTLSVIFVDLTKAFDSVSHQHIFQVVGQKEVDGHISNLLKDLYTNAGKILE